MASFAKSARVIFLPLSEISPEGAPGPLLNVSVSSRMVLPAPDGPTMARSSPSCTDPETSRSTSTSGSSFFAAEME